MTSQRFKMFQNSCSPPEVQGSLLEHQPHFTAVIPSEDTTASEHQWQVMRNKLLCDKLHHNFSDLNLEMPEECGNSAITYFNLATSK